MDNKNNKNSNNNKSNNNVEFAEEMNMDKKNSNKSK